MPVPAYDRARTALVLVDPYNEFLSENGRLWPRVRQVAEAVDLHRHLRELVGAVRGAGVPVFIAPHRRWRPGDFENWRRARRPHRLIRDGRFYEAGTFGGEWHPEFGPQPGDIIATEHWGISGFAHTDLDQQLRQHDIEHIILAGMTASGCVEGTGRYALEEGYAVTLVKDATAALDPDHMRAAIELTGPLYAEHVAATGEVVAALAAPRTAANGAS